MSRREDADADRKPRVATITVPGRGRQTESHPGMIGRAEGDKSGG